MSPSFSGCTTKGNFSPAFRLADCAALFLRERKSWENTLESGNVRFLAKLPTPESQSVLKEELKTYLSDAELQKFMTHRGDKEALILHW
jgi:ion channel-forming bestrophin family protein